jgi:thioredoxin 1
MAVIDLSQHNLDETIANNEIIMLDFWAPWCGPCLQFAPTFEEASEKIDGAVFAKVNTEEEQILSSRFGIRSIPTLMIFRQGVGIFTHSGTMALADIKELIEKATGLDMDAVRKELGEESE